MRAGFVQGKITYSGLSHILLVLIFLLPLVRYYNFPGTDISMETVLSFGLLCGLLLLRLRRKPVQNAALQSSRRWFLLFFIWAVLCTACFEWFTDVNVHHPAAQYSPLLFFVSAMKGVSLFLLLCGILDTRKAIRMYEVFCWTVMILYCVQNLLQMAGRTVSFKMPFLHFSSSWGYLRADTFGVYPAAACTGLFSERSHMAEYLLPYLAICLYDGERAVKNGVKKAVAVSAILITTISGNAIMGVFIAWIVFFLFNQNVQKRYKPFILLGGLVLLSVFYRLLNTIPEVSSMFSRLFVDQSGSVYEASKADYRIYRGMDLYLHLPGIYPLTGIGYGHLQVFSAVYGLSSQYDRPWLAYEYLSTVFAILLYFGLFGAFFMFQHLRKLFQTDSYAVKGLLVLLLSLWISSSMFFNNTHIMYILLLVTVLLNSRRKNETAGNKASRLKGEE